MWRWRTWSTASAGADGTSFTFTQHPNKAITLRSAGLQNSCFLLTRLSFTWTTESFYTRADSCVSRRLPDSATPRETDGNEGEQMDGNGSWSQADLVERFIKMFYCHVKDDSFTAVLGGDRLFAPNCCPRKSRQTFAVGLPLSEAFRRTDRIWFCIQLQQLLVWSRF